MALARDKGCTLVYILATSIYSQRIFANLKFDILNEFEYDEFKDENGEIFFKDMREHKTAQLAPQAGLLIDGKSTTCSERVYMV